MRKTGAKSDAEEITMNLAENGKDARRRIDECVAELKLAIPPAEHGALDSRLEELLNDSNADADDVILILRQEFDPRHPIVSAPK